jgi:hypothetical protein
MPSQWIKQPQQLNQVKYLNSGSGDSVVGGALSGVPSEVGAQQFIQNRPGDRMILGEEDAAALSDPSVGTLYGGLYQYVRTPSGSTATPTRGRAAFWDTSVANSQFQVTPDESGTEGAGLFAGVFINTLTKGYNWWIQQAGKVTVQFRATLTGIPAAGCPVFVAGAGAGVDVGEFDVLNGAGNPTFTQVANMMRDYVGVAGAAPADDTASLVNLALNRQFRW